MLNGIDVSAAGQGTAFGWQAYKGKVSFAWAKISQGTGFADPAAGRNIAQMRELGLIPGGYHFLLNDNGPKGGAPQARWFWKAAQAAGLGEGCLVAVDTEDGGRDGASLEHFDLVTAGFANELYELCGARPFVYTEISIAPSLVNCGKNPPWLANLSGTRMAAIGPWHDVPMEQTGQRGVDADRFYGTLEQLKAFTIPKR